jgi:tRNA G37 N-methylase Trm5
MEMEDVAKDLDITTQQGQEYLEMERSVVGLAEMIDKMESFADPEDMANLRTTLEMQAKMRLQEDQIEMQAKMRLQEDQITADLTEHLKAQAKTYTFLQAQTSMARDSLIRQKSLLSRVGLMKISENLLLKTSYMLIGNVNVTEFPEHFMAESKKSMEGMLEFSETSTLGKASKRSTASKSQSSYLAKTKERYLNRNK